MQETREGRSNQERRREEKKKKKQRQTAAAISDKAKPIHSRFVWYVINVLLVAGGGWTCSVIG